MKLSETELIPMTDRALKTENTDADIDKKLNHVIALMEHEGFVMTPDLIEDVRTIVSGEADAQEEIQKIVKYYKSKHGVLNTD